MMTPTQCLELRDLIFAETFSTGEHVFRYLSVELDSEESDSVIVHYAFAPAVWERGNCVSVPDEYLRRLIAVTPYRDQSFTTQYHEYLRVGWPRPWHLTAKESHNNFPLLVLRQEDDGRVAGVLMYDSHTESSVVQLADLYVEDDEVTEVLAELYALPPGSRWHAWYKGANIEAATLDEAIASTPQTDAGQKAVVIYKDTEWLQGNWTNAANGSPVGAYGGLELSSVADFHGTRVSEKKLRTRPGLDVVRAASTVPGEYAVLERAVTLIGYVGADIDYEADEAVTCLCRWWNENAPEEMRSASIFRAYIWDEENKTFWAGDPEEPSMQAEAFSKHVCFSLFEAEGKPSIAIVFFRGRKFNTYTEGETRTFRPDGGEGWTIGLGLQEVDEAYYSVVGMRSIAAVLTQADLPEDGESSFDLNDENSPEVLDAKYSVSTDEEWRARRIKNFGVRAELTREPDFEGEKTIYVTKNGRQEYPTSLAPHEARKLYDLLREEFGFDLDGAGVKS